MSLKLLVFQCFVNSRFQSHCCRVSQVEEKQEKRFRTLSAEVWNVLQRVVEVTDREGREAFGVLLPHYLRSLTEEEFRPLDLTSPINVIMEFGKFKVGDMLVKMFKEGYPISTELTLELVGKNDFTAAEEELLAKMVRKSLRDVSRCLLQAALHFYGNPNPWTAK